MFWIFVVCHVWYFPRERIFVGYLRHRGYHRGTSGWMETFSMRFRISYKKNLSLKGYEIIILTD